ncbi:MAG: 3-deoxy-D-manno-octulosonic acid transferase [Candidatus Competibacteraceae bacterium]|nr:3-deoxy-D-manno-octulosonic acid transferase [Candidatus Competibacteraceae bacterium]
MIEGGPGECARLADQCPPALLIIAEIPCLLWDAPCRLSYAILHELRQRSVPIGVVNGWLYHGHPSCRLDTIEKQWFDQDFMAAIQLYMVQTDDVRRELLEHGVDPHRVIVTGNIKFDALSLGSLDFGKAASPDHLKALEDSGRPTIVAGCVTNLDDQEMILDTFLRVQQAISNARLILAPRHPENADRMKKLRQFLLERPLRFGFKSEKAPAVLAADDVIILDTMGELRDFYAVGTITYVGLNHNVLEPMVFGKEVFVSPGWEPVYPSYPVYRLLRDKGILRELPDEPALADAWIKALQLAYCQSSSQTLILTSQLAMLAGATNRSLATLREHGLI